MKLSVLAGVCLVIAGCAPTADDEQQASAAPAAVHRGDIVVAHEGVANRAGCPSDYVRVTNDAVDVCVALYEAPGFGAPPTHLSFVDAGALCEAAGGRLCTEQEWVAACRGPRGSLYPYGDTFNPYACVTQAETPVAAGMRNRCRSGFGVYDLSGNAAEWVAGGLLKGGAYDADAFGARCGARETPSTLRGETLSGARCCREPGA